MTEVPETVHTPVVADVNATVNPDVAVADSTGGVSEIILSEITPKLIVWPLPITVIVMVVVVEL